MKFSSSHVSFIPLQGPHLFNPCLNLGMLGLGLGFRINQFVVDVSPLTPPVWGMLGVRVRVRVRGRVRVRVRVSG